MGFNFERNYLEVKKLINQNNFNKILNSVNSQRLKNCPIKIKTDDIKSILNMKI